MIRGKWNGFYNLRDPSALTAAASRPVTAWALVGPIIRSDLRIILGKIRNCFAHDLQADFSDEKIGQWCRALRWHKEFFAAPPPGATVYRDLFQVGVNQLVSYLSATPGIARSKKRPKVLEA